MSVTLERNKVIELLDKLGNEQDEDVLAAARMRVGAVTIRLGLDAAIEGDLVEMPQTNGRNVKAHPGVHIVTQGEIHLVTLKLSVLAKVPPVIDQMPRCITNAVGLSTCSL